MIIELNSFIEIETAQCELNEKNSLIGNIQLVRNKSSCAFYKPVQKEPRVIFRVSLWVRLFFVGVCSFQQTARRANVRAGRSGGAGGHLVWKTFELKKALSLVTTKGFKNTYVIIIFVSFAEACSKFAELIFATCFNATQLLAR